MANKYKFNSKRIDEFIALIAEGFKVQEVCKKLEINTSTFYKSIAVMPEFKEKFEEARLRCDDEMTDAAKLNIKTAIESGDLDTSKWWLAHKKRFGAFPTTAEAAAKNGNDNQIITPDGLI